MTRPDPDSTSSSTATPASVRATDPFPPTGSRASGGQPPSAAHLAVIFAVGLLARCAFLQTPQAPLPRFGDAHVYLLAARDMLAGNMTPGDWYFLAWHGPGYVCFLAGLMAVVGEDVQYLRYAQAGLGALTAPVLYAPSATGRSGWWPGWRRLSGRR